MGKYRFSLVLALTLLLASSAAAEYVGVAPGVKDLGTLERGETYNVKFYLVTNIEDNFRVTPNFQRPNPQIFLDTSDRYDFQPQNASQERIDGWVSFSRRSYEVDPSTTEAVALSNGGVASAKGDIDFLLRVPEDAEPGYHAGAVNINPQLESRNSGGGAGVSTLGLSQFVFVFRVPGVAQRDLEILDVNSLRSSDGEVRLDYLVKNNGTTTIRLYRGNTFLYDKFGNQTNMLTYGGNYIEPGETRVIQNYWKEDQIESGEYRVRSEMNYLTGQSVLDETVQVSDFIQIESSDDEAGGIDIPWWLILMFLALIGAAMLFFDIDPLIVIMFIGTVAISAFILYYDLPLLLIVLMVAAEALLVYRWFK